MFETIHGKYVWDEEVQKYFQLVLMEFIEESPVVRLQPRRGNLQNVARGSTEKARDAKLPRRAEMSTLLEGCTRRCTLTARSTQLSEQYDKAVADMWRAGKKDKDYVDEGSDYGTINFHEPMLPKPV